MDFFFYKSYLKHVQKTWVKGFFEIGSRSRHSRLMVRPFFYYELYAITFKRVFLETRFFQTAAIISQKIVNWFCLNLHSIFSTYIATSWTKIIKIASLVFFNQLNRSQKKCEKWIFFLKRKKNSFLEFWLHFSFM